LEGDIWAMEGDIGALECDIRAMEGWHWHGVYSEAVD
jgi:hypothetical protein